MGLPQLFMKNSATVNISLKRGKFRRTYDYDKALVLVWVFLDERFILELYLANENINLNPFKRP
jgi:hypothetical protein